LASKLALYVSVTTSWEDTHGPNIAGTYNTFEAARRAGVRRVIFASSNHAVGRYEIENLPQIYEPGFGLVVRTDGPYRPRRLVRRVESVRRNARAVLQRHVRAAGDVRSDRLDHRDRSSRRSQLALRAKIRMMIDVLLDAADLLVECFDNRLD
jgi:hypothetical protein